YKLAPLAAGNTIGTIAPAALTLAAVSTFKTYDGTTGSATPTVTGLVAGDAISNLAQSYDSKNAGARTLSVNPGFTINDGNNGGNSSVTTEIAPGKIGPAPLSVVPTSVARAFDTPNPPLSGTVAGLVGGDTQPGIGVVYSTTATTTSPPGAYPITATI